MKVVTLVSLFIIGLGTTFATTTDALKLTVNGVTATITDNGGCVGAGCVGLLGDLNPLPGTDTVSGTLGGWTISITSGTSYSPNDVPFGLDLTSLTATCVAGGLCDLHPLDVQFSDINFSPANPSFSTTYSNTQNGAGSTSESAYFSNCGATCSNANLFAETNLIGTLGPWNGSNVGTKTGGAGSVAPYSLTLDQMFTATGTGAVSFSVDGSVSSVPEPGAVMLFGTVLALCASRLRRRPS
jgi:hypothetical protein